MKTLLPLIFLALFSLTAVANDTVVISSPFLDKVAANQQYETVTKLYLGLSAGDSLKVINGIDATTIANLKIPNNPAYNSLKPKLKINIGERRKLAVFFKNTRLNNQLKGAIDFPRLLGQIARYPNITDVVVMGSPLYDVKTNPAMSMASGLIPSDGYLLDNARNNVFRTKGFENRLKGLRFHWLLPESLPRQVHAEAVQRFWHHFIQRQGGELISFSHDAVMVLDLLQSHSQALPLTDTLDLSGKLEMQAILDITAVEGFYKQPVSHTSPHITDFNQPITLGIQWQGDVDVDLFAKAAGGEMLYYGHVTSKQGNGKHFKDIRSGKSEKGTRYETIEFASAIDIRTLFVAINLYSATKPYKAIHGSLRIKLLGKVYQTPFHFSAHAGNKGADMPALVQGGADTAYSQRFSIIDMINNPQGAI